MSDVVAPPTRLERVVDVLAKLTGVLWVLGVVLLIVNSAAVHQHTLYVVALDAIRTGFILAFVIVVSVLGSVAIRRARAKKS
jgi:hypothetical protein